MTPSRDHLSLTMPPPLLPIRAAAFDLDGTLLDTIHDLADAINLMLGQLNHPLLPIGQVKTFVGKGITNLVRRALTASTGTAPDNAALAQALTLYQDAYEHILTRSTSAYPGVIAGLDRLRALGLPLACITNKATRFTEPLLDYFKLRPYFERVVSGDTLPVHKPDPGPLLHVAEAFGIAPADLLMVGDSVNDAVAARAAGCPVFILPYGYNEGQPVDNVDCDRLVSSVLEAAHLVCKAQP